MTTNSLHSLHQHSYSSLPKLQLQPSDSSAAPHHTLIFKPTTANACFSLSITSPSSSSSFAATTVFSVSPTSSVTPSTTSQTFSLDLLEQHLSAQDFRQADEETRRLLIVLGGEAAQKRGYVFFSEVKFISEQDLRAIDELWREYSNDKFGYSVQKRIWQQKANKDFTKFFIKIGWMKKLDTEVVQYNYRAFPDEFVWELNDDTPEGHLPLTNALRGTQLLTNILNHPAFEAEEGEDDSQEGKVDGNQNGGLNGLKDGSKPLSKRGFKPDYSF